MRTTPVDARTADLLDNPVKPYAWGSATELPRLLGVPPTGSPQAELWMGAHPAAPSRLRGGAPLPAVIEADPARQLSAPVLRRFGARLPFLMKIIAAERNLSLQTHPNLEQARAGYADEQQRRVPLDSPERSYVDPNHKPELVCALTPFEALCGFRAIPETLSLLTGLASAAPALTTYAEALRARPDSDGLREVVTGLLTVPADRRRRLVDSVVAACAGGSDDFPVEYATAVELGEAYPGDPGVIIALLLNRLRLEPGQALFLSAGNMHCYLRGTAVEVLASSDNVLRGGLTGKHVDVPELLRVVDVTDGPPPLMTPKDAGPGHLAYRPPVPDFRLDTFVLSATPVDVGVSGPRIVLTVDGTATLTAGPQSLTLPRGSSAWVPAGMPATVAGTGRLVAATTNL
ncbi:MAG TPA: mannose-6-phosphate isomerase, class I [Mycobacteriales bacterium]|nr:mannose-6-phosphate isomerase, class I [Mycobacteriales bacterium]